MKVTIDNTFHYKTSSNSSSHEATTPPFTTVLTSNKLKAKSIIKSFDSRGGLHAAGAGSSSNKSGNGGTGGAIKSIGGGIINIGGANVGGPNSIIGSHKRYKSSAGSSNCHSSFSNDRSKYRIWRTSIYLYIHKLLTLYRKNSTRRDTRLQHICLVRQSQWWQRQWRQWNSRRSDIWKC